MRKISGILAFLLTIGAPNAYAAGPVHLLRVGNWNGGSYTDEATGAFSHCAAGSAYNSGIYFGVSVTRNFQWALGFAQPSWRLNAGQIVPLDLSFDGRAKYRVYGRVRGPSFVTVDMPNNSRLIRDFRAANQMTAFANGNLFAFNLNSTSRLLPALVTCVQREIGVPQPAPAPRMVQNEAPSNPSVPLAQPSTVSSLNPTGVDMHDEAVDLATNFILSSKLDAAHLVGRDATPVSLVSSGAEWRSPEANGFVRIIPGDATTKGIDVTANVVSADAEECKGQFASARKTELLDSDVVFQGASSCQDSAGIRRSEYFVVPRKKGGFVLFSVVNSNSRLNSSGAGAGSAAQEQATRFEKAALTSSEE